MGRFPYADRRALPKIEFQIAWLGYDKEVIAVEQVSRIDLSEACQYAARQMVRERGHGRRAHGFHVQSTREESSA